MTYEYILPHKNTSWLMFHGAWKTAFIPLTHITRMVKNTMLIIEETFCCRCSADLGFSLIHLAVFLPQT